MRTVLFGREKNIALPDPEIDISVKIEGGFAYYTLKSEKFVRKLALYSEESAPFDDNYFDLLPNETVTVKQRISPTATEDSLSKGIYYNHAGRIKPEGSRFSDLAVRARVFLKPINLFNYLYYKYMMK